MSDYSGARKKVRYPGLLQDRCDAGRPALFAAQAHRFTGLRRTRREWKIERIGFWQESGKDLPTGARWMGSASSRDSLAILQQPTECCQSCWFSLVNYLEAWVRCSYCSLLSSFLERC
jgi:hypothetical protein